MIRALLITILLLPSVLLAAVGSITVNKTGMNTATVVVPGPQGPPGVTTIPPDPILSGTITVQGIAEQYHLQNWTDDVGNISMSFGTIAGSGTGPALKITAPGGLSRDVELALCQDEAGLRTYGGYFLVDKITSDFSWSSRTNNVDKKRLVIRNSDGHVGIGTSNPGLVNSTNFGSSLFHIMGTGGGNYFTVDDSSGYLGMIFNSSGQAANHRLWAIETNPTEERLDVSIWQDNGSPFQVVSYLRSGNMRIGGTGDTGEKLQITGAVKATGNINMTGNMGVTGQLNVTGQPWMGGLISYATNAAAISGGLAVGHLYRQGDFIAIVH